MERSAADANLSNHAPPGPGRPVVHAAIARVARERPATAAVSCLGRQLTYAELDSAANKLAQQLRRSGVQPGSPVAILLDRSVEMVVAVLAVLKAGCAYLPIDVAYPPARVAYLMNDAGAAAVISTERDRSTLPGAGELVISLDGDREAIAAQPDAEPDGAGSPDSLAYIIYTSGSTGQPKGVPISHRNVLALLANYPAELRFPPGAVHAAVASLAFDMSVFDLFAPLACGACVLVVPRSVASNPQLLADYLRDHGATSLEATPTTWRMLLDAGWQPPPGFRVLCGGEALSQPLADRLTALGVDLWHLYGPTEATVWVCATRLHQGDRVTLGRPFPGVEARLLDEQGHPVGPEAEGILSLGGAQVAGGYLNRPALTAERFVTGPGAAAATVRWYDTGDVFRADRDGALEFVGRRDHQVKLRGYRVELGEIEDALRQHPRVREAAVVVHAPDADGDPHLVAYVTLGSGERRTGPRQAVYVPVVTMLRRFVAESLPPHMIPERVVALTTMPVTTAGKIDRVRLAAVPLERTIPEWQRTGPVVAPRTEVEQRLVTIFERVLGVQPISVTDNFFELGATSVAAARLFTEVHHAFGAALPLAPLFQAPTVESLARLIDTASAGDASERQFSSLVPIQVGGSRIPIFCVHGGAGTVLHFKVLSRYLGQEQPFYGLQRQGLEGDRPLHTTVAAMARHYLREVTRVQPTGPYILAGYCFGAIVAQKMARQVTASGQEVALLMSFNGPTAELIRQRRAQRLAADRATEPPAPPGAIAAAIYKLRRTWWWLQAQRRYHFAHERRLLRRRLELWRYLATSALGLTIPDAERERAIFGMSDHLERTHRTRAWTGEMFVAQSTMLLPEDGLGWRNVPGTRVDAHHSEAWADDQRLILLEPAVVWLAEKVRVAVDQVMAGAGKRAA